MLKALRKWWMVEVRFASCALFCFITLDACGSSTETIVGVAGTGNTPAEAGAANAGEGAAAGGASGGESSGTIGGSGGGTNVGGNAGTINHAGSSGVGGDAATDCTADMPFLLIEPVRELNTQYFDWGVRLADNGKRLYFTSDRSRAPLEPGAPFAYSELYVATRSTSDGLFEKIELVKELSIPVKGDLNPSLTSDGLTLYFDSYRDVRHIWRTTRKDLSSAWAEPELVKEIDAPPEDFYREDFHPYVAPDGSALYFTSGRTVTREGTKSNYYNLWVSKAVDGKLQAPARIFENEIASGRAAIVSADQLVIYFADSRVRPDGRYGGLDIWMATRASRSEAFSSLRYLGELNTRETEMPSYITDDGCTLYFESDRGGGRGMMDAYRARRKR